jgi:RNA polymerase sigma-70 factor (ECF subfamily)
LKNQVDIAEKNLLMALKNDNVKAFDKLFADNGKRLYHFAYGYLKSKEEAESLVQEVFLKIWKNRENLNPDLSFKAYLLKLRIILFSNILKKVPVRRRTNTSCLKKPSSLPMKPTNA